MQPGTPYGNVSHIINQEMDVPLVSGGKLKYVIHFPCAASGLVAARLTSNSVRRSITCLSELHKEKFAMQFQSLTWTGGGPFQETD
jgi:hypothetical protein